MVTRQNGNSEITSNDMYDWFHLTLQALTIVWNIMRMKRLVKPIPGADVAMFAAAMSSIMYHLGAFRSDVKPFVRNPLERVVFGPLIPAAGKKTKPSEGEAPRPPKAAVRQD